MTTPLEHVRAHRDAHLEELKELLRIPSISAQPDHKGDVRAAAEWMLSALATAGMENGRLIETDGGNPLVYADWLHAGDDKPTVLIYGHYDVQPPEPLDLWESPPFEPTIRDDGYLYARGSSDDKGQVFIHVKAVEAYMKTDGRLPLNVKFIIEGEEEVGGGSLAAFIKSDASQQIKADVVLVSDTAMLTPAQPAIVYGLRGMSYMLIDVTGPARDLHSGSYGGTIDNPLNVLSHIIAQLKDIDGVVQIPGFYDNVRDLSEEERVMLGKRPFDEAAILDDTGAPQLWGEAAFTPAERIGARPTLDVHGIIGGYTGEGAKTVLPSTVHAKISMRLVPDQEPEEINKKFIDFVRSITPPTVTVNVRAEHGAAASIADWTVPAMQAASAAYVKTFGNEPILVRMGGSIPVVGQFQSEMGMESVLMGFGLPTDHIHSPNERFFVNNFYLGIETAVHFLQLY